MDSVEPHGGRDRGNGTRGQGVAPSRERRERLLLVKPFRLAHPEPTEAQVMTAVRQAMHFHPAVAACWRINSGSAWLNGKGGRERPVKFHDIDGCSDLIGILNGGRWLAIECKRPSTRNETTPAQDAFLDRIERAGGVAFVAWSADEAVRRLNLALKGHPCSPPLS